jgi:phage terminase small subunit
MSVLPNSRHEKFAQLLTKGHSATDAYSLAGYKGDRTAASRLSTNVNIQKRVEELKGKVAQKAEITIESLAGELEEARTIAIAEKQSSAAVSATMGKAKLFGLGVEKRHVSGTIQVINITAKQLEALTDDELVKLEEAYPILQKLGLISAGNPSGEAGEGSE